jgi:membrane-bound lytic murein transglycosylase A
MNNKLLSFFSVVLSLILLQGKGLLAQSLPLKLISSPPTHIGLDNRIFIQDKPNLLRAIDHSLAYLKTKKAKEIYRNYPLSSFSRERVIASLRRFRQLVQNSTTASQLQQAIVKEFNFYQSVGSDNQGTISFTGYFQPVYPASRQPNSIYRYPLYGKPRDFNNWSKPHPTRAELEGRDGLGKNSLIRGNELVWLSDRLQAYLVQVQGSAQLQLTDGTIMTIGYDGATDYPYTSLGKELIKEGKIPAEEMSLPRLIEYLSDNPQELDNYLPRNQRFIFFSETSGKPPMGSLNVPVTPERSIATDKSIMPPGALALIYTQIPEIDAKKQMLTPVSSRYVLDQDTGSAIKGAGRVDIFFGTGKIAEAKAGLVDWQGQLYYLLLK